jgi:uncharacterized protein (TIGR03083 family)
MSGHTLSAMQFSWEASRTAYADAAGWFLRTAALVGDRWDQPGLGEWDVRALVGHTCRSFVTVEEYLAKPPAAAEIETTADYYRAIRGMAHGPEVTQRGRDAGAALGDDPVAAAGEIADRVVRLVETCDGTELLTSLVGGMRLADYLGTRTFELAVHTCDLAVALGEPLDVPPSAAAQTLAVIGELAAEDGEVAGRLLLVATGRSTVSSGFSVL